jgi:hypothetical protein
VTGFRVVYKNTNRAKKGFFRSPQNTPYKQPDHPMNKTEKLIHGVKRDFKNFINPVNYVSPLLDWADFGFNLYVIGKKSAECPPEQL